MGFFTRQQLPVTSYGYQAPAGAVARGWRCLNDETCGRGGDASPRRWPFTCPDCGGPTDPALAEPWQHDARGVEIQYLLQKGVNDGGFTETEWPVWCHKDALRRNDPAAAARARAEYRALEESRALDAGYAWWTPGRGYFLLVWQALEVGDLDSAADDILHWLDVSNAEDVENDNERRSNCRNAIDSVIRFVDTPGATRHPATAAIREQGLALAADAFPILNDGQQAAVTRLSRS
jgi:hypothetical protein